VRPIIRLAVASVAVAAIACGKGETPAPTMSEDLKKDLQLATTQPPMVQFAADELAPRAQKELAVRPKKNPGPKVVRTATPTVKAAPQPVEVAEVPTEVPQIQVTAASQSDSDSPSPSAPPMARPTPVPLPSEGVGAGASTGGDNGGSGIGAAIGSVLGGILGGMARGGVVVGDDHCDPRTDRRRPRGSAGPVYMPSPNGVGVDPRRGREVVTRVPINPMTPSVVIGGRRR
jgi:hypothetical protein